MEESARQVSSSLRVVLRREERSRSPVSVQEWVAALPETGGEGDHHTEEAGHQEADGDGDDNLTLGAEGKYRISVSSSVD